jgi:hypothetical protein
MPDPRPALRLLALGLWPVQIPVETVFTQTYQMAVASEVYQSFSFYGRS